MPWFKVDDALHSHPKAIAAGTPALGLWVRCGSWSSDQLTDGFIPNAVALMYGTRPMARALVTAGLWDQADGGYQFHDWEHRNPLKEHVETVRDEKRKAGQAGGRASAKARANGKQPPSEPEAEAKHSASPQVRKQINPRSQSRPVVSSSLRDSPQLADAHEQPDHHETEQQEQLALAVHTLQPTWQLNKIREAITAARQHAGLHRVTTALLIVATAHDSQSPRRVLSDGYWWDENDTRYTEALDSPRLAKVLEVAS